MDRLLPLSITLGSCIVNWWILSWWMTLHPISVSSLLGSTHQPNPVSFWVICFVGVEESLWSYSTFGSNSMLNAWWRTLHGVSDGYNVNDTSSHGFISRLGWLFLLDWAIPYFWWCIWNGSSSHVLCWIYWLLWFIAYQCKLCRAFCQHCSSCSPICILGLCRNTS